MKKPEHSVTSPSSASRWIQCPGSIKYNKEFKGNASTEEGQKAHLEIAKDFDKVDPKYRYSKIEESRLIFGITLFMKNFQLFREKRVEYKPDPSFFGRSDLIILSPDQLHIVDFKNGTHVQKVDYNYQLLTYLLLAVSSLDVIRKYLYIHIVQPNAKGGKYIASQQIKPKELDHFEDICNKSREEIKNGSNRLNPGPVQCEWCAYKKNCPAYDKFKIEWDKKIYG